MLKKWSEIQLFREDLKNDWNELWNSKFYDNLKGESVSKKRYENLFVDQGEIIFASRDYKPLTFQEILEKHLGSDTAKSAFPDPVTGGWRKFAQTKIPKKITKKRKRPEIKIDENQHQRKGGNGWLNKNRIKRKKSKAW